MRRLLAAFYDIVRHRSARSRPTRRRQYEPELALTRLEERRLLNADFTLVANALQLDFTDPLAADTLTVSRDGADYKFEIDSGVWSGGAAGGVSGAGTDTLLIDAATANALTQGIRVSDDGDLQAELLAADFSGLAAGLEFTNTELVSGDSGPFAVPQLTLVTSIDSPFTLGPLDIDGDLCITAATTVDDFASTGSLRVTGDLSIAAGVLPGDYDGNAIVDTDDYDLWLVNDGMTSSGSPLAGDGNGDGVVDGADFTIWRDNFGRSVDAGTSSIDIGVGLNVEVGGATKLESRAGGDIRVGAIGDAEDSGRTVELDGGFSFQTTGDVQLVEDSTDGVALATTDFDGDATPDANLTDDLTIRSAGEVGVAAMTVDSLDIVARGQIVDTGATLGDRIEVAGDATLVAGFLAADFNADGFVDTADYTVWRDNFGQTDAPGDANGDGVTNTDDYLHWRAEFGSGPQTLSSDITLGTQVELYVGDLATFESYSGAIVVGAPTGSVEIGRLRFRAEESADFHETSSGGIVLDRAGQQLAAQARSIGLRASEGAVVLDSLQSIGLSITSDGDVSDIDGAQIDAGDLVFIVAEGSVLLADTPSDAFLAKNLVIGFGSTSSARVGIAGQATFSGLGASGGFGEFRSTTAVEILTGEFQELELTAAGAISNFASFDVVGSASFSSTAPGDIDLEFSINGPISLTTVDGDATIRNTPQIILPNLPVVELSGADIAGNLDFTTRRGTLIDSAPINVSGSASFEIEVSDDTLLLDQLNVSGPIALRTVGTGGDATIVNTTAIDFAATDVGGALSATALAGDVTNATGAVMVGGAASFAAAAGGITLGRDNNLAADSLSLAGGVADVVEQDATQLDQVAVDQLTLESGGLVNDLAGASIAVAGDASLTAADDIVLGEQAGDTLEVGGLASFTADDLIEIGPAGAANFGALSLSGVTATIQEDSTTVLQTIAVETLSLTSEGIGDNSNIVIPGNLSVVSAGDIILADNVGDVLTVGGAASFTAGGDIELGLAGAANFGTLALDTQTLGAGDASVREMSATLLTAVDVDDLSLESAAGIADDVAATISVAGDADFSAASDIVLADGVVSTITVDGRATFDTPSNVLVGQGGGGDLGSIVVSADEARVANASSLRVDGVDARLLQLDATGSITDLSGASIVVADDAAIVATGSILLANAPGDVLSVGADATLSAGGILFVGPTGLANFGRLSLAGTTVDVQEDSSTELFDVNATTLELTSTGSITDLVGATINVTGDAAFNAAGDVTLGDVLTESLTVGGLAAFDLPGDLTIGADGAANFGSLLINADDATVQEDSSTLLRGVTAASLTLDSAGDIADESVPPTTIDVAGNASFVAAAEITLADTAGDRLSVGGDARFTTTGGVAIDVGVGAAGDPSDATVGFGTLSFVSQAGATRGTVRVAEDDAMTVVGNNVGGQIVLVADDGDGAANATAASISIEGGVIADALKLQSDGTISQTVAGLLVTPVLQLIAGYDAAAFAADPSVAPTRSTAFTPDITLPLAFNDVDQIAIASANGSVEIAGQSSLTVAATTVDGRDLSGIKIVDARNAVDAADASLDLTLALTANGGGITQQQVDVLALSPTPVTIDVDVARTTFTVAGGESIQLLDMEVDQSAAGDTLLLNQDAVRSATTNRFFIDNAGVAGVDPSRQETELAFDGLGSAPGDIAIADQTGVQLGFAASDRSFDFVADGEVIVIAGKSPVSDFAISSDGPVDVAGPTQLHASGGEPTAQGGDIFVFYDDVGPVALTTDGGDASLITFGGAAPIVFRADIATLVRESAPGVGGDLDIVSLSTVTDQAGASIVVEDDLQVSGADQILLNDNASDVLTVGGNALFDAIDTIDIGPAGAANFGTLSLVGGDATVQEDSTTALDSVLVSALSVTSAGDLLDTVGASIEAGPADFSAAGDIFLVNDATDFLSVFILAEFTADGSITIGPAGQADFDVLSLDAMTADVTEDSSTTLDTVAVGTLDLVSAGTIDDVAAASIVVTGRATMTALGAGDITLADDAGDVLTVGGDAEFLAGLNRVTLGPAGAVNLGTLTVVAAEAIVQEDSTTVLDEVLVDTLDLTSSGGVLDVAGVDIRVAGDAVVTADDIITLNGDAADLLTVDGMATLIAGDDITVGSAGLAEFGSISLTGAAVALQEDNSTLIKSIDADLLALESSSGITDAPGATILVSGDADFAAAFDIVLAEDSAAKTLVVGGAASFSTATDIVLGPFGLANFGALSLAGDEATVQEDSTTQLDQVAVRVLTLTSTATIADVDTADITVTELATFNATTPFEDVILGDGAATLRLDAVDVLSAQHVSLQELDGFMIAGVTITGTLFATADTGSIEQLVNTRSIVADAIGLRTPSGGVLLHSVATGRIAAEAGGAIDIAGKSFAADALLAELADERIAEGDDTGLAPTTIAGDALAALAVDSEFGVTVLLNRGDLVIGRVSDPTTGSAGDADGVRSSGGHAFVETVFSRTDNPGPGDVTFEGSDTADGRAVVMENDHVFTAVASGELVIETATTDLVATGSLGLGTGVVTDVSGYLSYDDRDGFDTGVVIVDAVPKEGVGLVVTIPSTELDATTSRLVGAGNVDPETGDPAPNTQFIELVIGRARETNLGLQVVFADGTVIAEFLPATNVGAGPTPGDVFSHTFAEAFLGDGQTNPAFPDLPTSIVAFSDPRINLYSEGGAQNLNRSITPTGATLPSGPMAGAAAPERIDQFILATTQQVFQVAEQPVPPEVTVLFSAPPPVVAPTPSSEVLLQTSVDFRVSVATEEAITIEFGPLDESAMAEGEAVIIDGAEEGWEQGADNYLAEIKQEIRDSDRPAGRYVIKAERGGGATPDLTIYEKPSSIKAEPDGTLLPPGAGAAAPVSTVAEGEGDLEEADSQAAWTAAWIDWAQRDEELLSRPESRFDATDGAVEPAVRLLEPTLPSDETDRQAAAVDELMVGAIARLRRAR